MVPGIRIIEVSEILAKRVALLMEKVKLKKEILKSLK